MFEIKKMFSVREKGFEFEGARSVGGYEMNSSRYWFQKSCKKVSSATNASVRSSVRDTSVDGLDVMNSEYQREGPPIAYRLC